MKIPRLGKAAGEFKVGISSIVLLLKKKGIEIIDSPNTKLTQEMYDLLVAEFIATDNSNQNTSNIDTIEREIFNPETYTKTGRLIYDFEEISDGDFYGLINNQKEVIVSCKYKSIEKYCENLIRVSVIAKLHDWGEKNEYFGIINKQGEEVLFPWLTAINQVANDIAISEYNESKGIIDKNGKEIVSPIYRSINMLQNGLAEVTICNGTDTICQINKSGLVLFKTDEANLFLPYNFIYELIDGFAKVVNNRKYGLIDSNGNEIIPCEYNEIENYNNELFKVAIYQHNRFDDPWKNEKFGNRYGLIRKDGKIIVPCKFFEIEEFDNNYFKVHECAELALKQGEYRREYSFKCGIINMQGNEIIPCEKYQYIENFDDDFFLVSNSKGKGLTDKCGKEIVACLYDGLDYFDNTFIRIFSKNHISGKIVYGLMDRQGQIIVTPIYSSISEFKNGLANVEFEYGSKKYINQINELGEILFESEKNTIFLPYHVILDELIETYYPGQTEFTMTVHPINIATKLIKIYYNGRYGYINIHGEEIIPCEYSHIESWAHDYFIVSKSNNWQSPNYGVINIYGQEILPCKYSFVKYFDRKMFEVATMQLRGIVNEEGVEIIPCKYQNIERWEDDLFKVCNLDSSSKMYGIVNIYGEEIIPPKFTAIHDLIEDFALVEYYSKKGIINKNGKEIAPVIYDSISNFINGLAEVEIKNHRCQINDEGLVLFKSAKGVLFLPYNYISESIEGLAKTFNNGKWGLINDEGLEITPCIYESIHLIENGSTIVSLKNEENSFDQKYGVLNNKGEIILPLKYDYVSSFGIDGETGISLLEVKYKGKHGVCNSRGAEIISPIYEYISSYNNLLFEVKSPYIYADNSWKAIGGNKYGLIDNTGKIILPVEYDSVFELKNGFAEVVKDGKRGYINSEGKLIIQCKYDNTTPFESDVARVAMGSKWGLVDSSGRVRLLCNKYNYIRSISDNKFIVGIYDEMKKMKFGAIDILGKELIPCKYDWIRNFNKGIASFNIGGEFNKQRKKFLGGKWGLITSDNTILVDADKYDYMRGPQNNMYVVGLSDFNSPNILKYGAINTDGKEVIPCEYDWLRDFNHEITAFGTQGKWLLGEGHPYDIGYTSEYIKNGDYYYDYGKWGLVDIQNNVIVQSQYDVISSFKNGYANIKSGGKFGFVDSKKRTIHMPKYDKIYFFSEGLCAIGLLENGKLQYGFIDENDEIVISCQYDKVSSFKDGKAYVEKRWKSNHIDTLGNLLHEWEAVKEYEQSNDDSKYSDSDLKDMYRAAFENNPDAEWNID